MSARRWRLASVLVAAVVMPVMAGGVSAQAREEAAAAAAAPVLEKIAPQGTIPSSAQTSSGQRRSAGL
ncbi:hypothetical protein OG592_42720 (plasmid) [Streptomyces avidinii]|uniref:hypothetical protein n=1 Tax=Streptomyces avidinii TaxID=1895 RepID=UPI002F909921|nr:hypothetical protein OG592_42720 [Streptomyces avidinii]